MISSQEPVKYRIVGKFGRYRKFGECGESSVICQIKTIGGYINNPLTDLFIR